MQKYEILSVIGEGAYGVVLKCRDVENQEFAAIKKFKQTDDEQLTKKVTLREIKILKMLSHENIVCLHEAFRKKGIVYLVFEYLENNLLEILEKSDQGLPPALIKKLMFQLLKGVAYLHNLGIVHRDIKPENILVNKHEQLKICDFGFARHFRSEKDEVQLTDYVATRWYRAPQLLVGGSYGKQIDIWAIGCIMCELIDGNPLFPGKNEIQQIFLIQKMLGPLSADLHQRFIKNQRYLGVKFPESLNTNSIERKYFGKLQSKGISFIKYILQTSPQKRPTAEEALAHPYFQSLRRKRYPQQNEVESISRKQTYMSVGVPKNDENGSLQKITKYGKIYNNKRKTNYNIAIVYQSSNKNAKQKSRSPYDSVSKSRKKLVTEYDHVSPSKKGIKEYDQIKIQKKNGKTYQNKLGRMFTKNDLNNKSERNDQFPLIFMEKKMIIKKSSSKKAYDYKQKSKRNQTISKLSQK